MSYLSCIVLDSKVVHSNTWFYIERVFLQQEKGNRLVTSDASGSWTLRAELMNGWIKMREMFKRKRWKGGTECWLCSFSSRVSSVALGKWLSSFSSARRPSFYMERSSSSLSSSELLLSYSRLFFLFLHLLLFFFNHVIDRFYVYLPYASFSVPSS